MEKLHNRPTDAQLVASIASLGYGEDEQKFIFAMMGRYLFFPRNQIDEWKVMPYLTGCAGRGKSRILSIMEEYEVSSFPRLEVSEGRKEKRRRSGSMPPESTRSINESDKFERSTVSSVARFPAHPIASFPEEKLGHWKIMHGRDRP